MIDFAGAAETTFPIILYSNLLETLIQCSAVKDARNRASFSSCEGRHLSEQHQRELRGRDKWTCGFVRAALIWSRYSLVPGSNRWRQAAGWKCRRAWRRGVLSRRVVPEGLTQLGESKQGEVVRLERLTAQWLCQLQGQGEGPKEWYSFRLPVYWYYWVCAPCRLRRTGLCLWSHTDTHTHRSGRELFMWLGSVILTLLAGLSRGLVHYLTLGHSQGIGFYHTVVWTGRQNWCSETWLDHSSSLAPATKTESLSCALCLVPYFEPTYRLIVRVTRRFPRFPIPLS